jgi:hypothetical protein
MFHWSLSPLSLRKKLEGSCLSLPLIHVPDCGQQIADFKQNCDRIIDPKERHFNSNLSIVGNHWIPKVTSTQKDSSHGAPKPSKMKAGGQRRVSFET